MPANANGARNVGLIPPPHAYQHEHDARNVKVGNMFFRRTNSFARVKSNHADAEHLEIAKDRYWKHIEIELARRKTMSANILGRVVICSFVASLLADAEILRNHEIVFWEINGTREEG